MKSRSLKLLVVLSLTVLVFVPGRIAGMAQGPAPLQPQVVSTVKHDVSPALRDMALAVSLGRLAGEVPSLPLFKSRTAIAPQGIDPVLQRQAGALNMPSPVASFDGVNNQSTLTPPDTQGDIGYDPATGKKYYLQWVNIWFAVWDVTNPAAPIKVYPASGFAPGNILWQGFGGDCQNTNDGDPITLFDPIARRWLMSQFALPNYPYGPFSVCVAVSQTADPTGSWYRYAYVWTNGSGQDVMNDYPKFGVWPDGYYMTVNQFASGSGAWRGAGVAAFERDQMLQGLAAQMVKFDLYSVNSNFGGMLPSDFDGLTLPPTGAPNLFAEVDDASTLPPNAAIRLWKFHVNWASPGSSTFGLSGQPNLVLNVADYTQICSTTRACVPQAGTSARLDAIGDRLMYRLAYRNFGDHEALVVNHTVDAGGSRAGVRWYELRKVDAGAWSVYQQSTYAPDDGLYRWMGSAAMDHVGNMALGYSVSSSSINPAIRYTGRLAADPLSQLPQAETTLFAGSGSQTSSGNRWGDYSMMGVDPVDDCTFWYTQEYYPTTSTNHWYTRIGSFKFPDCNVQSQGTLAGRVSDASTGQGIAGALVQASAGSGQSGSATSDAQGNYTMPLYSDSYTVTASAYGFSPGSATGISITAGMTTTLNFTLTAVPVWIVTGTVTDATTGWPLYAHVAIQGTPHNPPAPSNGVWNDPVTGLYSMTLAGSNTYTFAVNAWATGYQPTSRAVGPLTGDTTANFGLTADASACAAPGYSQSYLYNASFEAGDAGYAHGGVNDQWQWGAPTVWPDSCASGAKCWGTDLGGNYANNANMVLTSTVISLAGVPNGTSVMASWQQAYHVERSSFDQAYSEVSINGSPWTAMWSNPDVTTQVGWTKMTYDISSAAGGTVQFRWRLISDSGVNYEGLYVDDVAISVGCNPVAGGLVVGNVYDANTSVPLAGAQVANSRGDVATTQTTPDPATDDSFYTIFVPAGSQPLTATMTGGYAPAVMTPTVVQSNTVRQDFILLAGRLAYLPPGLQAALLMGQSTALPLTLTNNGALPVTFTISEIDQGYGPLAPTHVTVPASHRAGGSDGRAAVGAPFRYPSSGEYDDPNPLMAASARVLILYADNGEGDPLRTMLSSYPDIAPVTFNAISVTPTLTDLLPYDVVIAWNDLPFADPIALGNVLADYVDARGRVILAGFAWYSSSDLAGRLVVEGCSPFISENSGNRPGQASLDSYVFGHPIMLGAAAATERYRNYVSLAPGANVVARWSDGEEFIATKGRVVAINSYPGYYYQWTGDLGIIWHNAIKYLMAVATDVPWLSESSVSGTLASAASQPILVGLDAQPTITAEPGQYRAQLWIQHNTPYTLSNVPITLTVSTPAIWGKLTGTVNGLGVCDAPGAPLANATVLVQSSAGVTWTLSADAGGRYRLWLDSGSSPLTVTASYAGYVSATQTGITVTAQATTTLDYNLRLNAACVGGSPSSFDVTLNQSLSTTLPFTLTNTGAQPLTWSAVETPDAAWLSESPTSGTGLASSQIVSLTFDSAAASGPGVYQTQLQIVHNAPQPTVTVLVRLTVVSYGVELAAPTSAQSGNPGAVVTYTLRVTNTGNATDMFTVTRSSSVWATSVPTSIGPVAAGAGIDVAAHVTIPLDAASGATDAVTITLTSQGDPTQSAVSTLTTHANTVRGLMLTPSTASESGSPGAVVTYTLRVTNTGNLSDTFTLSLGPSAWSAQLPLTTTLLAANAGADVSVYVTIPLMATVGVSDTVQVRISGTGVSANSLLTTSVVGSRIFMPLVVKSSP